MSNQAANQATVERKSDRELIASRVISGTAVVVYEAWSKAELFRQWWVPKSAPINLESCEMDVRTGGTYRLVFSAGGQSMAFFGKYLDVAAAERISWTNEEGGEENASITTVTFQESSGATLVTVSELYPTKDALDEAFTSGSSGALPVQLEQLEEFIVARKR